MHVNAVYVLFLIGSLLECQIVNEHRLLHTE